MAALNIVVPATHLIRNLRSPIAWLLFFFAAVFPALAIEEPPLRITQHVVTANEGRLPSGRPTHLMKLTLAVMKATNWDVAGALSAAQDATAILNQCGIRTDEIETNEFEGPARFRSVFTPVSRELAKRLVLPKPTLFFVADTLNRPAFDAEAVGRANSRTRPEMADTVWIAYGARDLAVVIAHELAHVLADSGEHSAEPHNLMREETGPGDTHLTAEQCAAIKRTGSANGLLHPLK